MNRLNAAEILSMNIVETSEELARGTVHIEGVTYHLCMTLMSNGMGDDFFGHACVVTDNEAGSGFVVQSQIKIAGTMERHEFDGTECSRDSSTYQHRENYGTSFWDEVFVMGVQHKHAQKLREALHRLVTCASFDARVF